MKNESSVRWVVGASILIVVVLLVSSLVYVRRWPEPEALRRPSASPSPTAVVGAVLANESPTPQTAPIAATAAPSREPEESPATRTTVAAQPAFGAVETTGPCVILTGRVTLRESGAPSEGARVAALDFAMAETSGLNFDQRELGAGSTDAEGRYRVVIPVTRLFQYRITRKGCARVQFISHLSALAPGNSGGRDDKGILTVERDFVLEPGATLGGHVVDAREQPLQGVQVAALVMDAPSEEGIKILESHVLTDAEGRFSIEDVTPGEVGLSAWREGYTPWRTTVEAPKDDILVLLASGGGAVEGRVYLKSTGEAVPGATVTLFRDPSKFFEEPWWVPGYPKPALSDDSGAFRFDNLSAGTYWIRANKGGLLSLPATHFEKGGCALGENEVVSDVSIFLFPGYTLRGRVTERGTGKPIEGARVFPQWGDSAGKEAFSDADGNYVLAELADTTLSIGAEKKGYSLHTDPPFQPGIVVTMDPAAPESTRNLEMLAETTISGRVTLASGEPAIGATVAVVKQELSTAVVNLTSVDGEGKFKIPAAPFASTRVKAVHPGYPPVYSDLITLSDQPVDGVEILLESAASAEGTVADSRGNPVEGAEVRYVRLVMLRSYGAYEELEPARRVRSDSQGRFALNSLPSKCAISLVGKKEGYAQSELVEMTLKPGESKTGLRLTLPPALSISGKVVSADGDPLPAVNISASPQSAGAFNNANAFTDKNGAFELKGLAPGTYRIDVFDSNQGHEQLTDVEAGKIDLEVVLKRSGTFTLIGKVVDGRTGDPIEDFTVVSPYNKTPRKDTDQPGVFIAEGLNPHNSIALVITAPGFMELKTGQLSFPPGPEVVERTFRLSAGAAITGRVLRKSDGAPLEGVRVHLLGTGEEWELRNNPAPQTTATTDAEGRFRLFPAAPGANMVVFLPSAPLVELRRRITVSEAGDAEAGDIPLSGGGGIKVRVVRGSADTPVPNVEIELVNRYGQPQRKPAFTDAAGLTEFQDLPPESYVVIAKESGLRCAVQLGVDETLGVTLRFGASTIKGLVVQSGTPKPAFISARGPEGNLRWADTDDAGQFQISDLAAGVWRLEIRPATGSNSPLVVRETLGENETIERTYMLASGRVRGRVVNEQNEPVADARVQAVWSGTKSADEQLSNFPDLVAMSNSSGEFEFAGLRGGPYGFTAQKDRVGFAQETNFMVPNDGDAPYLTLRLRIRGAGTLVSVALKMSDGKPLQEAWCRVWRDGAEVPHPAQRDNDGVLRIAGLAPGTYQAEVSGWGYSIHRHTIEILADRETTMEDVLYDAGAVRWTLQSTEGAVVDALCTLTPEDPTSIETPREGRTDNTGLAIFRGLFPGDYRGEARLPDGRTITERFQVIAHEVAAKTTVAQ